MGSRCHWLGRIPRIITERHGGSPRFRNRWLEIRLVTSQGCTDPVHYEAALAMGSRFSRQDDEESNNSTVIEDLVGSSSSSGANRRGGRKRKHDSSDTTSSPAKGGKLYKLDTPKYVYQKLFIEGHDSDVALTAVCRGKRRTWQLHKVYLEQCDYFRALFQRNRWKDSEKKEYTLDIIDKNICFEGRPPSFSSQNS